MLKKETEKRQVGHHNVHLLVYCNIMIWPVDGDKTPVLNSWLLFWTLTKNEIATPQFRNEVCVCVFQAAVSMLKQDYKEGEMTLPSALALAVKVLNKTMDVSKLSAEKGVCLARRRWNKCFSMQTRLVDWGRLLHYEWTWHHVQTHNPSELSA